METINLICFKCIHWNDLDGCEAFPDGIPDGILMNNEHSRPLPGQDNDFVFQEFDKNTNYDGEILSRPTRETDK